MDIRDLSLDILQLPDNFFGRRFLVSCNFLMSGSTSSWDISELGLPEKCVLWELYMLGFTTEAAKLFNVRLALGDVLPTTTAEVDALEPLIPGLGITGAEPRVIVMYGQQSVHLRNLKYPISSAGRRLVVECTGVGPGDVEMLVLVTVSSIPTEVPDCLLSV